MDRAHRLLSGSYASQSDVTFTNVVPDTLNSDHVPPQFIGYADFHLRRKDDDRTYIVRHTRKAPAFEDSPEGTHYLLLETSDNDETMLAQFRHELAECFGVEKIETQELAKPLRREEKGKQLIYTAILTQTPLTAETLRRYAQIYGERYAETTLQTLVLEGVPKNASSWAIHRVEAQRAVCEKLRGNTL